MHLKLISSLFYILLISVIQLFFCYPTILDSGIHIPDHNMCYALVTSTILIFPFTVNTPQIFSVAGEAGGMKNHSDIESLSIFPRLVILCPFLDAYPNILSPANFPASLLKFPKEEIATASINVGSIAK